MLNMVVKKDLTGKRVLEQKMEKIGEHRYTVLSKIRANCTQEHIERISHHDQVGFIAGMQGWSHICKLIPQCDHATLTS